MEIETPATRQEIAKAITTGTWSSEKRLPDPKCKKKGCYGRGFTGYQVTRRKVENVVIEERIKIPCSCIEQPVFDVEKLPLDEKIKTITKELHDAKLDAKQREHLQKRLEELKQVKGLDQTDATVK